MVQSFDSKLLHHRTLPSNIKLPGKGARKYSSNVSNGASSLYHDYGYNVYNNNVGDTNRPLSSGIGSSYTSPFNEASWIPSNVTFSNANSFSSTLLLDTDSSFRRYSTPPYASSYFENGYPMPFELHSSRSPVQYDSSSHLRPLTSTSSYPPYLSNHDLMSTMSSSATSAYSTTPTYDTCAYSNLLNPYKGSNYPQENKLGEMYNYSNQVNLNGGILSPKLSPPFELPRSNLTTTNSYASLNVPETFPSTTLQQPPASPYNSLSSPAVEDLQHPFMLTQKSNHEIDSDGYGQSVDSMIEYKPKQEAIYPKGSMENMYSVSAFKNEMNLMQQTTPTTPESLPQSSPGPTFLHNSIEWSNQHENKMSDISSKNSAVIKHEYGYRFNSPPPLQSNSLVSTMCEQVAQKDNVLGVSNECADVMNNIIDADVLSNSSRQEDSSYNSVKMNAMKQMQARCQEYANMIENDRDIQRP